MKTIQEHLKEKFPNIEMDHHESDLYISYSPEVWDYLKNNYEFFDNCSKFHSAIDKALWIELPFAYDPFWNKKLNVK